MSYNRGKNYLKQFKRLKKGRVMNSHEIASLKAFNDELKQSFTYNK